MKSPYPGALALKEVLTEERLTCWLGAR